MNVGDFCALAAMSAVFLLIIVTAAAAVVIGLGNRDFPLAFVGFMAFVLFTAMAVGCFSDFMAHRSNEREPCHAEPR